MKEAEKMTFPEKPAYIEERIALKYLQQIQYYGRVNQIDWMADGAEFAEMVMGMLRKKIDQIKEELVKEG